MTNDDLIRREDALKAARLAAPNAAPMEAIAALPAATVRVPTVDELAQIIRAVDGENHLGTGELAERILDALDTPAQPALAETLAVLEAVAKGPINGQLMQPWIVKQMDAASAALRQIRGE